MIKSVKLESFQRGSMTLALDGRSGDPRFRVLDIAGLEPPRASISTAKRAFADGTSFRSARTDQRNIVIQLGFNPRYAMDETVQQLRGYLQRLIPIKEQVVLTFESQSHPTVKIAGWVESAEPAIFSREPMISISIICPEPYFTDLAPTTTVANPNDSNWALVDYKGTAPTGFRAVCDITRSTPGIQITHYNSFNQGPISKYLIVGQSLQNGDKIAVSTVPGDKYIRYFRSPNTVYITGKISSGSAWLQLMPLLEDSEFDHLSIQYLDTAANIAGASFTFTTQYGGL